MIFLVAISVGPVQEFIAAARRTQDLWAGSQLLAELSREAAQVMLKQHGAMLIFPADEHSDGPNKILVRIEAADATEVSGLVEATKGAVRRELRNRFDAAVAEIQSPASSSLHRQRAESQIESFLEIYAAWTPEGDSYTDARLSVERLLAGRKSLRDFAQPDRTDAGVPKSPLDPSRAAVFWPVREFAIGHHPLRLKRSESLDAISLLKRIEGITRAEGSRVVDTTSMAHRATVSAAFEPNQEPEFPYFAILAADGDRMGEGIGRRKNFEAHREFSRALATFGSQVRQDVEDHDGFLVYCGGDDVLAFLPVTTAIKCAAKLAGSFRERVVGATLSVGVALVHHKEPLSRALEYGRAAEKAAKDSGRNALAVAVHTRGGSPMTVAAPWTDDDGLPHSASDWETWISAFTEDVLARGAAYELAALSREWRSCGLSTARLRAEALRIWKRKFDGEPLPLPEYATRGAEELMLFANKLIVARFLTGMEVRG